MTHEDERLVGRTPRRRDERGRFVGNRGKLNETGSVFEKSLFQEGVLEFETPAAYFAVHSLMRGKEMETVIWLEHFKGRVPARWDRWGDIIGDFGKAKEASVQLSPTLIDAGVTHWHHVVVATVAKTQRLTPIQIAMALEAGDAKWFREDILNGQEEMGTPIEDIREAAYIFLQRGQFNLKKIPFRGDVRTVE